MASKIWENHKSDFLITFGGLALAAAIIGAGFGINKYKEVKHIREQQAKTAVDSVNAVQDTVVFNATQNQK